MRGVLEIRVEQLSGTRRALVKGCGLDCALTIELVDQHAWGAPHVEDGFALLLLFFAMEHASALRIHAPLSRSAFRNMHAYQEAWRCLCPDRYRVIPIEPDDVVALPRGDEVALSAFSGGVDASFLAVRHGKGLLGRASYPLKATVIVQGFDVDYDDKDAFDRLRARTRAILEDCGLTNIAVRTNFRKVIPHNWEHCFAACVAGVMHQFGGSFGYGMLGSSEPYSRLISPWGSTPAIDYLLSGDAMEIVHEGAGYSRTEKVAQLAPYRVVTDRLKVCWEGRVADRNCGHCEKCIRTRLNFLAAGVPSPMCFDTPFDLSMVDTVAPRNSTQIAELATIVEFADRRDMAAEWLDRLRHRLAQLQGVGCDAARSSP